MKTFVELAAEAAEELKAAYAEKPEMELIAWLQIASKRESMVSAAYDGAFVEVQLAAWQTEFDIEDEVIEIVRKALMSVWSQENGHQAYFRSMIKGIKPSKKMVKRIEDRISIIRGDIEGRIVAGMMSKKLGQRISALLAIAVGEVVEDVPEYVKSLRHTTFGEFCSVNADLEHTAVLGYERMIELGRQLPDLDLMTDTTALIDLKRTATDERYHKELFRKLSDWPPGLPPGGDPPAQSPMGPAPIASETLTVADARDLIAKAKTFAYGVEAEVLGDVVVVVNEDLIFNDPLIQHLREFAAREEEEGEAVKYMTAGA